MSTKARSAASGMGKLKSALEGSYRHKNIYYMDWNSVDWYLVTNGLAKLSLHTSTMDAKFGILLWNKTEYEYLVHIRDGKVEVDLTELKMKVL